MAVLGNPNAGKTTLFNALTGLSQKVANFPGVTVEKKTGRITAGGHAIELIDLPGTYSLAAHSPDELVAVDVLLGQQAGETRPDAILAVVDASNLDRNLYLVCQLLDLEIPLVLALNMVDVAIRKGVQVDPAALGRSLGIPVVITRADRRIGVPELREELVRVLEQRVPGTWSSYELPADLKQSLEMLQHGLEAGKHNGSPPPHRVELLRALIDVEGAAEQRLCRSVPHAAAALEAARRNVASKIPLSALEAQSRYRWIREVTRCCVRRGPPQGADWTDRLDRVLTHRLWGALIFAGAMLLLFQAIFSWATPAMGLLDSACQRLGVLVGALLPEGALRSLIVDGVIAGVGAVVVFLPQILLLSLFLALLEDCGYMARAAFLMDRLMSFCGLSGKSFIPMLSGFACAVPAVMATRVIENRRDRLATILVTPLMTCSARLPVYTILIAAFIPDRTVLGGWIGLQAFTLLGLYVLGIVTAMAVAFVFKRTLLRGPTPPFVLELPTYKVPAVASVVQRLWERGSAFLFRAGKIILAVSIVVWALSYFPRPDRIGEEFAERRVAAATAPDAAARLDALEHEERAAYLENSLFGRLGKGLAPAFAPLGWDWRITMAALASFPAREVVVAVLGTIYSLGDDVDEGSEDLREALRSASWPDGTRVFTIPVALSLLVFFALCCQCGATLATIRRETGSWGWAFLTFGYMTLLAYLGGAAAYQGGNACGLA